MEFYKEGKVLTVNAGDTLDLNSAIYNHKAVIIKMNGTGNGFTTVVGIKFWNKGNKTQNFLLAPVADISAGSDANTNNFTNMVIPVRLAEIDFTSGQVGTALDVILFN